jgi:hypothetical protein
MDYRANNPDPWVHILSALGDVCRASGSLSDSVLKSRRKAFIPNTHRHSLPMQYASFSPCVTINILERLERVATIAWLDPTACHYAEQRWQRSVARRSGTCALSGEPIARGDDVFRPSRVIPEPMNSRAMILARALPAACGFYPPLPRYGGKA